MNKGQRASESCLRYRGAGRRSGQAILFMLMVGVILFFVVMWQFDLHKTLFVKYRTRDAGDAAALAAARWQGITLNLIGELNVMQAAVLTEMAGSDPATFEAELAVLHELRARLALAGPLTALAAAQLAAKNNGIYVNADFTQALRDHVETVRSEYALYYPPPYDTGSESRTAWEDYADMLEAVADHGLAVEVENFKPFEAYSDFRHYLLNPFFYEAVAGSNWCWFHHHARALLSNYVNWTDWPALPELEEFPAENSEFFGLGLQQVTGEAEVIQFAGGAEGVEALTGQADRLAANLFSGTVSQEVFQVELSWHGYDPDQWSSWMNRLPEEFPFKGGREAIRSEYDYTGADAAVRLVAQADRISPGGRTAWIYWTAAAKPFGYLEEETGRRIPPDYYGLVLPGFKEIRLIPVDASSSPGSGSEPGWNAHIYDHLESYLAGGPERLEPGCWYCEQLRIWENSAFRESGQDWLDVNSGRCQATGGSGGASGGSRRGH